MNRVKPLIFVLIFVPIFVLIFVSQNLCLDLRLCLPASGGIFVQSDQDNDRDKEERERQGSRQRSRTEAGRQGRRDRYKIER